MTPATFPQVNLNLGPPNGMDESQVATIPAWSGGVKGGPMDGADVIVVAWKPNADELIQLGSGNPVFIAFFGRVPPHCVSTEFPA